MQRLSNIRDDMTLLWTVLMYDVNIFFSCTSVWLLRGGGKKQCRRKGGARRRKVVWSTLPESVYLPEQHFPTTQQSRGRGVWRSRGEERRGEQKRAGRKTTVTSIKNWRRRKNRFSDTEEKTVDWQEEGKKTEKDKKWQSFTKHKTSRKKNITSIYTQTHTHTHVCFSWVVRTSHRHYVFPKLLIITDVGLILIPTPILTLSLTHNEILILIIKAFLLLIWEMFKKGHFTKTTATPKPHTSTCAHLQVKAFSRWQCLTDLKKKNTAKVLFCRFTFNWCHFNKRLTFAFK